MSGDFLGVNDDGESDFNLETQLEISIKAEDDEKRERALSLLRQRKTSYGRVFLDGGATPDDVKTVLDDLAWFCRADRSTFHANTHMAARLDGRREVWLRIQEHLALTVDQLAHTRNVK